MRPCPINIKKSMIVGFAGTAQTDLFQSFRTRDTSKV